MSNMDLWNKVSKTDPRHTKDVSLGRKFTAIDAHYQVMRATETFGPVGQGWGYTVEHSTVTAGNIVLAAADVIVWHGDRSNCFGPWRGLAEILNAKGKLDDDAAKKATTDALTKGLSHIGFSADVFMGLFDDNKYVNSLKKEFAEKEEKDNAAMQAEEVDMAIEAMQGCADLASLQGIFGGAWKRCGEGEKQRLQTAYENLKACFLQAIPDDEKEAA